MGSASKFTRTVVGSLCPHHTGLSTRLLQHTAGGFFQRANSKERENMQDRACMLKAEATIFYNLILAGPSITSTLFSW